MLCFVCIKEANNMVQEANIKRMATERKLDEATAKVYRYFPFTTQSNRYGNQKAHLPHSLIDTRIRRIIYYTV